MPREQKLIIKRAKWLRGEGHKLSSLLRQRDGKMCCLGFYMRACRVKKKDILNVDSVTRLYQTIPKRAEWLTSWVVRELEVLNDSEHSNEKSREVKIKNIFKRMGNVDVRFVD